MKDKEKEKERRGVLSRQPSRAVIISALAAGGVFQLNGWQVQAHGNRSSHSATAVSSAVFTPDDYVLQKQGNAPASLDFVRAGDADAAIAMIEGEGWTGRVLSGYNSALIAAGGQESHGGLVTLAKAAMAYSEKALKSLPGANLSKEDRLVMEQVAEVYHNVASFTLPESGAASVDDLKLGREAAERALELRQSLHQKPETMVAYQMVGKHYLRANQVAKAQDAFASALKIATELNDPSGIAGSKSQLAQAKSDAIRGK